MMRTSLWVIALALISLGGRIVTLAAEPAPIEIVEPSDDRTIDFEREVLPILRANCLACHSTAAAESELVLETPATILKGGAEGAVVVPGKAEASRLLALAARRSEPVMPPEENKVGAKPLLPQQLGVIRRWIDQGARGTVSSETSALKWQVFPSNYQPITAAAMTADGRLAACSRANRLQVYDLSSDVPATTLADPLLKPNDAADVDSIRALAFNHRGDMLASGGFRTVRLWRRNGPHVESVLGSVSHVSSVATSLDGRRIGFGSSSGEIRWSQIEAPDDSRRLGKHDAPIGALALSSNGRRLASVAVDKTIRIWNLDDGESIAQWTASSAVRAVLFIDEDKIVTAHEDGRLQITTGSEKKPALLTEVAVSPGKALTALAGIAEQPKLFLSAGSDGHVRLWNMASEKPLAEFDHGAPINAVAAGDDGTLCACAGNDGRLTLWSLANKKLVAEFYGDNRLTPQLDQLTTAIHFAKKSVGYRQQEAKLVTTSVAPIDRSIVVAEKEFEDARQAVPQAEKVLAEKTAVATELIKERDAAQAQYDEIEQALAAATKAESAPAVLRELEAKLVKARVAARTTADKAQAPAGALKRAADDLIAAKSAIGNAESNLQRTRKRAKAIEQSAIDAENRVDQLERQRAELEAKRRKQPPLRTVHFAPGGRKLIATGDAPWIQWINVAGASLDEGLDVTSGGATAAACLGPKRTLLVGADGRASVCSVGGEWKLERTIGRPDDSTVIVDRVLRVAFSPDDRQLVTAGGLPGRSGELKLWNVDDGRLVHEFKDAHLDVIYGAAFSPRGDKLASTSADRNVKIFSLPPCDSSATVSSMTLAGHTNYVLTAAWQPDGTRLATGGADNVIKIWDPDRGEVLRSIKGDPGRGEYRREITGLAFVGPGELFVAASGDGTVRLHRTSATRDERVFPLTTGFVNAVCALTDGRYVAAGGEDGVLRVWLWDIQQAPPKLFRSFDPAP